MFVCECEFTKGVCIHLRLRGPLIFHVPFADLVMGTTDVVHVLCADQSAAPGGRAATVA